MDIVFNQHANGTFDIEYFQYTPSKEAGLAFLSIFAVATVVHVGYMFFFRSWSFIPMILGGICMFTCPPWFYFLLVFLSYLLLLWLPQALTYSYL